MLIVFSDTYNEAKLYLSKNRAQIPVNYSEDDDERRIPTVRRPNEQQQQIAEAYERIRIKSERITNLQKAISILNIQNDKRQIEIIDSSDVDEYDELLSDDESEIGKIDAVQKKRVRKFEVVQSATDSIQSIALECEAGPSDLACPSQLMNRSVDTIEKISPLVVSENDDSIQDDDLIEIDASGSSQIITGVEPLQIDKDFSMEYSYTTDVSRNKDKQYFKHIYLFIFSPKIQFRNGTTDYIFMAT